MNIYVNGVVFDLVKTTAQSSEIVRTEDGIEIVGVRHSWECVAVRNNC